MYERAVKIDNHAYSKSDSEAHDVYRAITSALPFQSLDATAGLKSATKEKELFHLILCCFRCLAYALGSLPEGVKCLWG